MQVYEDAGIRQKLGGLTVDTRTHQALSSKLGSNNQNGGVESASAGATMGKDLDEIRAQLRRFAEDRDWDQFHSPKNLASALIVEAGELLERFQWLTEEQSRNLTPEQTAKAADELADVFVYAIRLADKLGIDLIDATQNKLARNAEKYPIEKARGNAKKYTEL